MSQACVVYRCSKQPEMYVYLRPDLSEADLPPALAARTGRLTPVMNLELSPERRLARVDVARVIDQLAGPGYFLQMPPNGIVQAWMNDAD